MLQNRRAGRIGLILVFALIAGLLAACGGNGNGGAASGKAVATYKSAKDGEVRTVTKDEFNGFLGVNKMFDQYGGIFLDDPSYQRELLKQYIAFRIFSDRLDDEQRSKAEKDGEEDFKSFWEGFEQNVEKSEREKGMKEIGVKKDDIKNYIVLYTLASVYMDGSIEESDIKAEFDSQVASDPNAFTTATVSHILIGTTVLDTQEERTMEDALKLANEVRGKVVGGADFAEMALEYSDDGGSKNNGGTYKDAKVNGWVPAFRDAALTLPINEISQPVETEYGYHIMKVEDRKVPAYEEVKDEVRSTVVNGQFGEFMETELPDLIVEILLPEPTPEASAEASPEESPDDSPAASGQ